ncbi:MAG: competence/damage-inducible protein A [Gloeocapsa sp. DLM2.Bin57]|nr:MAG: competence/damage-inducible protein A [Gloeocapsa sp. DLM2.Bin57]
MSAEIICVGTELLLGNIVNTNAKFLAEELANLGIPHYYETIVGDNIQRLQKAIAIACERSSILIFTGGLGPTPDDLTTEAIAAFFQTPLVEHPEILGDIQAKFAARGREMSPNNAKQALIPQGAQILPNPVGTAPGMIWQPQPGITILTFPGVPREMKAMWQETAILYLKTQGWGKEIIYSRVLKFRGIGESNLAVKVNKFFDLTNPTVAPYASLGEVKLRISTKAATPAIANNIIQPIAQEIIAIAGNDYFGADEDTLASVVGNLLIQRQETLSVAESCTGGGIGELLTSVSGSSSYFMGGVIAYANEIKTEILGVNPQDLAEFGAVSEVVAKQMAIKVKQRFKTDWGLSVTGIAGPTGGTLDKPVGLVCFGFASPNNQVDCLVSRFGANQDRETIRYLSVNYALDQLRRKLQQR